MKTGSNAPSPAACRIRCHCARALLLCLTLATTACGTLLFYEVVRGDGINFLEFALLPLFTVLFSRVAWSFWTATIGFAVALVRPVPDVPRASKDLREAPLRSRTAILMPIYNESPPNVFASLQAMRESLAAAEAGQAFDFFVLSDTTDPDIWLEEERLWAGLVAADRSHWSRVFYRRRPRNVSRKSGNIADFCRRWGAQYEYMIVLDADSVMDGSTMIEMARRMDADPQLGILQVPPQPVNRMSFFARLQQFSARLYGPVYLQGFASWAHFDSNYWGHNAILRVEPFTRNCGLPLLPGKAPLGGEILSHDFVEAALMARAHWKIGLAHDLGGSYEECPTTLLDYAMRDQRWCQGNLQHVRLIFSQGFRSLSRFHLASGAMAYLASPLWLLFMLLSIAAIVIEKNHAAYEAHWLARAGTVFALTMALLLIPKLWGVLALVRQPVRLRRHGGWAKVLGSVAIETIASTLIAPVMMFFHTRFVVATLLGQRVQWTAQNRGEGTMDVATALSVYGWHTLAGILGGVAVAFVAPGLLPWFSPVFAGLLLSITIAATLDSVDLGQKLARLGLLLIPEETAAPDILKRQEQALETQERAVAQLPRSRLFQAVLFDPAFHALHQNILRATGSHMAATPEEIRSIVARIDRDGPSAVPAQARKTILSDADALREIHIRFRSRPTIKGGRAGSRSLAELLA